MVILAAAFLLQPTPDHPNMMHLFWTGGLTVIAVAVAAACLQAFLNPSSALARVLSVPPLPHLGLISYGIYLYHYPFVYFLLPRFDNQVEGYLVVMTCTLIMSTVSWWLLEKPIISWGRRNAAEAASNPPRRARPDTPSSNRSPPALKQPTATCHLVKLPAQTGRHPTNFQMDPLTAIRCAANRLPS